MKFAIAVLFLTACVALGYAQRRCESPKHWEARAFNAEPQESRVSFGSFYYDSDNQRTAFYEEEFQNGVDEGEFVFIFLHKEKTGYKFSNKTLLCNRFDLTEPFRPINVSLNARFIDTFIIGTNADERYGVAVNIWEEIIPTTNERVIMEFVADDLDGDEDCFPISYTEFRTDGFRHQSFYNIVLGDNPSRYEPPPQCRQ